MDFCRTILPLDDSANTNVTFDRTTPQRATCRGSLEALLRQAQRLEDSYRELKKLRECMAVRTLRMKLRAGYETHRKTCRIRSGSHKPKPDARNLATYGATSYHRRDANVAIGLLPGSADNTSG